MISLNKNRLLLLIAFILLLVGENICAQTTTKPDREVVAHDTTTLAWKPSISGEEFKFQVRRFTDLMQKGNPPKTVDDCIILVRLFNTLFPIDMSGLAPRRSECFNKDKCEVFYRLFRYNYFFDVVYDKLNFRDRKGGEGQYSFKYDLGLGTSSFEPAKKSDYYHVLWK